MLLLNTRDLSRHGTYIVVSRTKSSNVEPKFVTRISWPMASRHAYSLGTHAVSASPLSGTGSRKEVILIQLWSSSYCDYWSSREGHNRSSDLTKPSLNQSNLTWSLVPWFLLVLIGLISNYPTNFSYKVMVEPKKKNCYLQTLFAILSGRTWISYMNAWSNFQKFDHSLLCLAPPRYCCWANALHSFIRILGNIGFITPYFECSKNPKRI